MRRQLRDILFAATLLAVVPATAHPGGTDGDGCHVCRTNCAEAGESADDKHCHEAKAKKQKKSKKRSTSSQTKAPQTLLVRVKKIIDGDTIRVVTIGTVSAQYTVRLKGIDCPESHRNPKCEREGDCETDAPRGKAATTRARELLDGQLVQLVSARSTFERDRYDRLLAYVHLADSTDVGLALIEGGFCEDFSHKYPHPRARQYKLARPR